MIFYIKFIKQLMNLNCYVPDSLIPIMICFPTYDTSCKFSRIFYENYKNLPQHKVLFDEYVIYTGSSDIDSKGYKLGSMEYINEDETEYWYKNGVLHRENDKPAIIWFDGSKQWWKNGLRHRENNQPAGI